MRPTALAAFAAATLATTGSLTAQSPLQVYVLVGQSNMQGHAKVQTFDYIGDDPKTAPLLARMCDDAGAHVRAVSPGRA